MEGGGRQSAGGYKEEDPALERDGRVQGRDGHGTSHAVRGETTGKKAIRQAKKKPTSPRVRRSQKGRGWFKRLRPNTPRQNEKARR